MPFDWKITRNRKTKETTLEVWPEHKRTAGVTATGPDIWDAREKALAAAPNEDVRLYILGHVFPEVD